MFSRVKFFGLLGLLVLVFAVCGGPEETPGIGIKGADATPETRSPIVMPISVPTATPVPIFTPTPVPDAVTLHSLKIDGDDFTVVYTKGFVTCVHLLTASFLMVHTQNYYCSQDSQVAVTQSLSNFSVEVGTQLKLCHGNNANICSDLVTVTTTATPVIPTQTLPQPVLENWDILVEALWAAEVAQLPPDAFVRRTEDAFQGEFVLAWELAVRFPNGWTWGEIQPDLPLDPYWRVRVMADDGHAVAVSVKSASNTSTLYETNTKYVK